jgi:hypothetical protein
MKSVKLNFENQEELDSVIQEVYFSNHNNGRLLDIFPQKIKLSDTIQMVLDGMEDHIVKLKSSIIDGTISCEIIHDSDSDNMYLKPISRYCVINEYTDKYSFY